MPDSQIICVAIVIVQSTGARFRSVGVRAEDVVLWIDNESAITTARSGDTEPNSRHLQADLGGGTPNNDRQVANILIHLLLLGSSTTLSKSHQRAVYS